MDHPSVFVSREKLAALLWAISELAEYDLDDSDLDAVSAGLTTTDAPHGLWFEYPFFGGRPVDLRLALEEPGSGLVSVAIETSPEVTAAIRGAALVIGHFDLSGGPRTTVLGAMELAAAGRR